MLSLLSEWMDVVGIKDCCFDGVARVSMQASHWTYEYLTLVDVTMRHLG